MATDVQSTLQELCWLGGDDGNQVTDEGKEALATLLEALPVKGPWGSRIFNAVGNLTVRSGVELVIVRENGGKREVLLTWRDDEYFRGWHLPGTMKVPRETYQDTATRCALREIGTDVRFLVPLQPFNQCRTGRFHDSTTLVLCDLKGEPTAGEWFSAKPDDLLDCHEIYWPEIQMFLDLDKQ